MVVAMAGGGLVFKLLQVQISCDRACKVSNRSLMNSHWNVSGLRGVLAALRGINQLNKTKGDTRRDEMT